MGRHTTGTVLDDPAPDPASPVPDRSIGDTIRFVLRGIGQTLITFGLIVLLFVFYEVYVTNWFAAAAQDKVQKDLVTRWQGSNSDPLVLPSGKLPHLPLGQGIANLYIPRLGRDYAFTIVEGTSQDDLEKGPGHYPKTALPGQVGNFGVAGHRVGKGEPFLNLDHLQAGDPVIVETESHFFVYTVKGRDHGLSRPDDNDGIPGREIVDPGTSDVLYAVPDHAIDAVPKEKLMTMTTCHPKFTAQQRMIYHAVLTATYAKPTGTSPMPGPVQALYDGTS
jgi:sortase A